MISWCSAWRAKSTPLLLLQADKESSSTLLCSSLQMLSTHFHSCVRAIFNEREALLANSTPLLRRRRRNTLSLSVLYLNSFNEQMQSFFVIRISTLNQTNCFDCYFFHPKHTKKIVQNSCSITHTYTSENFWLISLRRNVMQITHISKSSEEGGKNTPNFKK